MLPWVLVGLLGLVVVLLVGVAIVADDKTGTDPTAPQAGPQRDRPSTESRSDLRTVDLGTFGSEETIPVTLEDGDVSFLLTALGDDREEPLAVIAVRDPDGETVYTADNARERASGGLTAHVRTSLVANGEVSLIAPAHPGLDVRAGTYEVVIDNIAPIDVSVAIKSGADLDQESMAVDVKVWATSATFDDATLRGGLREGMDRVLTRHDLRVGDIEITFASASDIAEYGTVGIDDLTDVCAAAGNVLGYTRALNLVLVEGVDDDLAGVAAGLPGPVEEPDARSTCVVAATGVAGQDIPMANIASAVVHEGSHFMGLTHTTEQDGSENDDFADTAACDLATYDGRDNLGYPGAEDGSITAEECGLEGAADNYMFFEDPYADIRDVLTQDVMSADQAWALRRHPLFHPVGPWPW